MSAAIQPVAARRWDTTYPGGQWLYFTGDQDGQKLCLHKDLLSLTSTLESLQRENEGLREELTGTQTANQCMMEDFAAMKARAEAAEAEVKRYRVALIAAKARMRNCRGAIESDQVVDKDVHGSLGNGIRDIQKALASTGGEHHAE